MRYDNAPMTVTELEARLKAAFPDGIFLVRDTTGAGDHFSARIVSARFEGLGPVDRHRLVYGVLGDAMRREIHALSLETLTPSENPS